MAAIEDENGRSTVEHPGDARGAPGLGDCHLDVWDRVADGAGLLWRGGDQFIVEALVEGHKVRQALGGSVPQ